MRNTENNRNEIYLKKFQIAKIKNPQKILGGNIKLEDDATNTGTKKRN